MTQIRIFQGTATQIQKNINAFLAQESVRYVDIKYQVAGSDHLNASAILVYEKQSDTKSENGVQKEQMTLQSVIAMSERLDEISEQLAGRLGLNVSDEEFQLADA